MEILLILENLIIHCNEQEIYEIYKKYANIVLLKHNIEFRNECVMVPKKYMNQFNHTKLNLLVLNIENNIIFYYFTHLTNLKQIFNRIYNL